MSKLADVKISRKLGLLIGASILQLVCLTGVAVIALNAIHGSMAKSAAESRRMVLSQTISANIGGIAQRVATLFITRQRGEQLQSELLDLRKAYMAAFEELKASGSEGDGKRLLVDAERTAARWREADIRALALLKVGKRAEAINLHDADIVPRFHELSDAMLHYRAFSAQKLTAIDQQAEALIAKTALILIAVGLSLLLVSVTFGVAIARSIATPLSKTVANLEKVAQGDLSQEMSSGYLKRKDEVGMLAKAVQTMTHSLREVIGGLSEGVEVLSTSSTDLSNNSLEMSKGSHLASGNAHAVTTAAEVMNENIRAAAAGIEETSTNLASVASATEQMTTTIGEIASNSEKARRVTEDATRQATHIKEQMNQLGEAAQLIGKVTETITEISSQTNLLALNATIEAARAGSAGKGFAVVANEIKELAQQTAAATEDIKGRINGVQSATSAGIAEIGSVSKVIGEVSDLVSAIAAAIEEQSTVTKDIARNVAEAAARMDHTSARMAETSRSTAEITREIEVVDEAAGQLAAGSEQVLNGAAALSAVSGRLQTMVSRFRVASGSSGTRQMLKNAISGHLLWVSRLKAAIATGKLEIPVATIHADNQCQFGQWLYGAGLSESEKHSEVYGSAKQLHARFHQEASKVAELAISGQKEAAEKAMSPSSEYARCSSALMDVLAKWNAGIQEL